MAAAAGRLGFDEPRHGSGLWIVLPHPDRPHRVGERHQVVGRGLGFGGDAVEREPDDLPAQRGAGALDVAGAEVVGTRLRLMERGPSTAVESA